MGDLAIRWHRPTPRLAPVRVAPRHAVAEVLRPDASAPGPAASAIVDEVLRSPGRPLDPDSRAFFEPRFGRDLGEVRVRADAGAARSARAVGALAYTVGRDVVFGAGRFAPGTAAGRRLLAHELTHVLQQRGGAERLSRVPTESGVRDGRYTFSSNCGWIDWSHADPALVAGLIRRVRQASENLRAVGAGASAGELSSPTMSSTLPGLGTVLSSASVRVRLLRPLSADEVDSVALGIFKKLSIVFETQQEWTDLIGESSFAQEDLPSNLIAFYMAVRGYTRERIEQLCGAVDRDSALREFERNHDFRKNRGFEPIGAAGTWPAELSSIADSQAAALYEVLTVSASQGTSRYTFCPMYRVVGTIGETDLLITSVGGTTFTAADNVRVVPTYRAYDGTSGRYGHVPFIQVEPYSQPDFHAFRHNGLAWPLYVPSPVLVCLTSRGNPV